MISIYVYMRLRLIEKSTTIDRYLIMSRVPGALKPFGEKATGLRLEMYVRKLKVCD